MCHLATGAKKPGLDRGMVSPSRLFQPNCGFYFIVFFWANLLWHIGVFCSFPIIWIPDKVDTSLNYWRITIAMYRMHMLCERLIIRVQSFLLNLSSAARLCINLHINFIIKPTWLALLPRYLDVTHPSWIWDCDKSCIECLFVKAGLDRVSLIVFVKCWIG